MTRSRTRAARALLALALSAAVAAPVSTAYATGYTARDAAIGPGDTRIGLAREGVDGAGRERVAGKVVIHAPSAWTRTSNDTAPTAKFTDELSNTCSATVQVSVRVVATGQTSRSRVLRVTKAAPAAVIADNSRPGGWLRIIRLSGSGQALLPVTYGIAIVRVEQNRWVDVRAYSKFSGCTDEQVKSGSASAGLRMLLHDARVHARIVRP